MKKLLIAWVPVIMWASLIFTFSSFPTGTASGISWMDYFIKKSAHMIEYATLTVLIYRGLLFYRKSIDFNSYLSFGMVILYAISDEWHQSFVPGRTSRPYDVLFDTIGASLAIYLLWSILPNLSKKLKSWAKKLGLV